MDRRSGVAVAALLAGLALGAGSAVAQVAEVPVAGSLVAGSQEPRADFEVVECTIAEIHRAMAEGRLTAHRLVELHLERIAAYDRAGPALHALITVAPDALAQADRLDAAFAESGFVGPLHGVPVIVKDNFDTFDLETTAGSAALAGSPPPDDAFVVRKLREAGAVVLAKSNMAEFAFSPYQTVGSMLGEPTRNPYDLERVPAGSSGGTAAAVAASLGVVGLGTDTGNSIRGPSSHCGLVGLRPTMGLCSRDGIVPLYLDHDVGGPMGRTVQDVACLLDVLAGSDPADPVTAEADARRAEHYASALDERALEGARLGVSRQIFERPDADPEVLACFEEALALLEAEGAELVDPVVIPEQDSVPRGPRFCPRFRHDLEEYLRSRGDTVRVHTLEEVIESGLFHPSVRPNLEYFARLPVGADGLPDRAPSEQCAAQLRTGVRRALAEERLDALIFPTWSNPPRRIGDLRSPHGDNSQDLAPHTGFPALTVPMGSVGEGLPVGLQFLGDAWSEPRLLALAYAFEQARGARRPPRTTPSLHPREQGEDR